MADNPTLTMCRGLPASGKSTWATAQVLEAEPGRIVRVNRDSLRTMLHADRWDPHQTEPHTVTALNVLVGAFLEAGLDVIVDDTNLTPYHEAVMRELADRHGATFRIEDFTHIDLDTCIERDRARDRSVGEDVIRGMHARHLAPTGA